MSENEEWRFFRWHCVNCGHIVQGLKTKDGKIKVECDYCRVVMVRIPKSRRTDEMHITAPKNQCHL